MLGHILIPLDSDDAVEASLAEVRSLIKPGGKVTLLAALDPCQESPGGREAHHLTSVSRELDALAHLLGREGLKVHIEVQQGELPALTYNVATAFGVDAIVLAGCEAAKHLKLHSGRAKDIRLIIVGCPEVYYG